MLFHSFRRQLIVSFLVTALLPLIFCSLIMVYSMKEKIERDDEKTALVQQTQICTELTSFLKTVEVTSDILGQDSLIKELLQFDDATKNYKRFRRFYEITEQLQEQADFNLYSIDGYLRGTTNSMMQDKQLPIYWGILHAARKNIGKLIFQRTNYETSTLLAGRMITSDSGNLIGYLTIKIKKEQLEKLLRHSLGNNDVLYLLDAHYHPFYDTGGGVAYDDLRQQLLTEGFDQTENGIHYTIAPVKDFGLYLILCYQGLFTKKIMAQMYQISGMMSAASLFLCIMTAIMISKTLTRPIEHLMKGMKEVEQGNLDAYISTNRKDEIGTLTRQFNGMTKELREYLIEQLHQQQELAEADFTLMQAQLNPHFLYNTLDTMKWMAKSSHMDELADMSSSLAKILRISITSRKMISLKEEMTFVTSYIKIQQIRFSERFSYDYSLPVEFENYMVPKLILQPLAENSIVHGLEECNQGYIRIVVKSSDSNLVITVEDNGKGMTKEQLDEWNQTQWMDEEEHKGLTHVDRIIKLRYGQKYGIYLENGKEAGLTVTVLLPLGKGEVVC